MHHYDDERMMEVGRRGVKSEQASYQQSGTTSAPVTVLTPQPPIQFRVDGTPVAQPRQRHRIIQPRAGKAFVHNYTPAKSPVADFKARVAWAAKQAYRGELIEGPIKVEVTMRFPLPTSAKATVKRTVRGGTPVPHVIRPDAENVLKSIFDSLTGIVWRDDSQIYQGVFVKLYGEAPGIEVTIWPPV